MARTHRSDFFSGVMLDNSDWGALEKNMDVERLSFNFDGPVSLYGFLEAVRDQLIGKLATDYRALFSAVTEIISGLAINAGTMMKRATGNAVYAVHGSAAKAAKAAGRGVGAVGSAVGAGVSSTAGAVGGATRSAVGGATSGAAKVGRAVVGGGGPKASAPKAGEPNPSAP